MVADGSKQLKTPVIPPPELLVQKFTESRAPELESLYSTVANRLNNDFRSRRNKRRRTTSYDNRGSKTRFRKKQKVGVLNQINDENTEKALPRRIRRRKELNKNPESGFGASGDGTKRLRTHVWHAKRFTMTKRWDFHLPLGLLGRGRGSRALLKWFNNGVVVHDASYYCVVQLEGSQYSLSSILSSVMSPFPSSDAEKVLSGAIYASSMLHHDGAPNSGTIGPIIYMWRPLRQRLIDVEVENHDNGCENSVEPNNRSSLRQLWIWIHAAAFTEGYNALKTACERQGKIDEGAASVSCTSLEGQLGMLEVMGSKASQLLQKILRPVSSVSKKSSILQKCSFRNPDSSTPLLENEELISCSGIISLMVNDPRSLTKENAGVVSEAADTSRPDETAGCEVKEQDNLTRSLEINTELDAFNTDLWDAIKRLCCPLKESVLCMEKHHQRLSSFCIVDKSSEDVKPSTKMNSSRFCPILLLKRKNLKDSITRWSVVLPLSWIKAFWIPLIVNGARAIGLRERSWVACNAGIPNFPSEFPECDSYASFMEAEAAALNKEASLRPPSMRRLSVPIPPPWDCVRLSRAQICSNNALTDTSLTNSALGDSDMEAIGGRVISNGFVARTSSVLAGFLNDVNGDHLLLCPHFLDMKTSISKMMKDEKRLNEGRNTGSSHTNEGGKVCFVRVILRAFKEGVIEEGAVVCAPRLDDIKLWTSSSNNKAELQIPQSSMSTYFVKQDSGKWEFRVPEDPAATESSRWPIGFVTSGFVRGSKKPSAGALCEAVLLARLRREQWRRKEIYVLTRNLRSTAYRLALASIVLEKEEQDIELF